jgi:hypothetical protein
MVDDLRDFLAYLGGYIHLVAIMPDGPTIGRDFGNDKESAAAWALEQNAEGKNIYFTVNRVRPGVNKKPTKADIAAVRFAHVDIDPPKDGGSFDALAICDRLENSVTPPSFFNWSGNGVQAFWRLKPGATIEQTEQVNRGLIAAFGGDAGTHNIDRLMRVPGTDNHPNATKRAAGRTVTQAKIEMPDDHSAYAADVLSKAYPAPAQKAQERESVDLGDITPLTSADVSPALTHLIDRPTGQDKSADTLKFACEALRVGLTAEQVMGVLLNSRNAIAAHCLSQQDTERAARRAVEKAMAEPDVERYRRQREEDRRIGAGEGADGPEWPTARLWTKDEMREQFVYVVASDQIVALDRPQSSMTLSAFRNYTAASVMQVELSGKSGSSRTVTVPTANQWLKDPERKEVQTLTFNPSGEQLTKNPKGMNALNLWTGFAFRPPPEDWERRVEPLLNHVRLLWVEASDPFLDWTAHITQRPWELPSFGWLHIAPEQGLGRNWVASVLARVFAGVTALGVDLGGLLTSQFNGVLSGRLLAVVDEVAEGSGAQVYRTAQALKRIVTEETRLINPKFGTQREEFNACRWLVLSNSGTALPLEDNDRRFWVVRCDDRPQDADYYSMLYRLREDPAFIASVAHMLRSRDISAFNPGARPPMTEAKKALLTRTRSDAETVMRELSESWPADIISSAKLCEHFDDGMPAPAAMRHLLDRVGWVRVGRTRIHGPLVVKQTRLYAIRNVGAWKSADPEALRVEMLRGE